MNNQLQANPSYVIEELVTQNAKLSQENAMLNYHGKRNCKKHRKLYLSTSE